MPANPSGSSTAQNPKRKRQSTSRSASPLPPVSSKRSRSSPRQETMSRTQALPHPQPFKSFSSPSHSSTKPGPKLIKVTNLRARPRTDPNEYYNRICSQLDACLIDIFAGRQPQQSLEQLYKGVQDICRQNRAERLFQTLRDRCNAHLVDTILPTIKSIQNRASNIEFLRHVYNCWWEFNKQMQLIRSIFYYLDRSYLLNSKEHPQLNDMAISQFRNMIFGSKLKEMLDPECMGVKVMEGLCSLVFHDRMGEDHLFDRTLLKNSISMLHVFGIYKKYFDPIFVFKSKSYFETYGDDPSSVSLGKYIDQCGALLRSEEQRCDIFNFDTSTKKTILRQARDILVAKRSAALLNEEAVGKLIDQSDISSLKALYGLLSLCAIQKNLVKPWEAYIKRIGSSIVGDKEKGGDMVIRLLELKRSLDIIIRDSFSGDEAFTFGLRQSFGTFMNDGKAAAAWGSSSQSRVGEMIAKYIDSLLKGGLKAVPRSLASDSVDRDIAEKSGQASTGDEDAELDRQLEQGLELFRFIEGKDVFEAFYKRDLARRLLMGRSASQDAERNMLSKLKAECGSLFTHNLETMFKDQELAREEMTSYKRSLFDSDAPAVDFEVQVLSGAAWPTYPDIPVNLPAEVDWHVKRYEQHYQGHHQGRRLTWKNSLAHCTLRARFARGVKELVVSGFQAIVLILFNNIPEDGHLSYQTISEATGLVDAELARTLQSLACAKLRVLTKHPKGRDVNTTDSFTINKTFHDPKFRIKINTVQLKETKQENDETHERVARDRKFETQAAIVRIMKSRKNITHANLVSEVINQTKSRGAVEVSEIKQNIESLIEKDYMERNDDSTYTYIA